MKKLLSFALLIAGVCYALNFLPKPELRVEYSMNAEAAATISEILENR